MKVNEVVFGETTQFTSTLEPDDWKAEKGIWKMLHWVVVEILAGVYAPCHVSLMLFGEAKVKQKYPFLVAGDFKT